MSTDEPTEPRMPRLGELTPEQIEAFNEFGRTYRECVQKLVESFTDFYRVLRKAIPDEYIEKFLAESENERG